jgi:hypothetical protein
MLTFTLLLLALEAGPGAAEPRWCYDRANAGFLLDIVPSHIPEINRLEGTKLTADSLEVVTDELVCEQLARAELRHELGGWGSVAVVRAGPRYYVDAGLRAGEFMVWSAYSLDFELIESYVS